MVFISKIKQFVSIPIYLNDFNKFPLLQHSSRKAQVTTETKESTIHPKI